MAIEQEVGSRILVLRGKARRTDGGLTKKDLTMKNGRVVSKEMVKRGNEDGLKKWRQALKKAATKMKLPYPTPQVMRENPAVVAEARKIYKKM